MAVKNKDLHSVEEKLNTLHKLQIIDSEIDKLQTLKGELPMEVSDLEDDIAGLNTRLETMDRQIEELNNQIETNKNKIKDCKSMITKYSKQLDNVKNNREYDALSKEIELQKLEIQLAEKRSKEAAEKISAFDLTKEEAGKLLKAKNKNLKEKKSELDKVIEETDEEEKKLRAKSKKAATEVEERLLKAYNRIRHAYKNGLAVVTIQRESCGGCYAVIPPQRQLEIKQKKRIITCEHCGRILVAAEGEAAIED